MKNNFKPMTEETISDIIATHPHLTREFIISKHEEIYNTTTDEEIDEYFENMKKFQDIRENDDFYIDRDFAKRLLLSSKEADADLTISWDIVKSNLNKRMKKLETERNKEND